MTNTHTYFDREPLAIEMVRERVFRAAARSGREVLVWSAGCATGEEPYSLAIAAREVGARVRVFATDIDAAALDSARRGRYSERSLRRLSPQRRARWLTRSSEEWEVGAQLRELVTFAQHDLTSGTVPLSPAPGRSFDVIFCRNVFIYHPREAVERAMALFARVLSPQGFVVPGASEWLGREPAEGRLGPTELASFDGVIVYEPRAADANGAVSAPFCASTAREHTAPGPRATRAPAPAPAREERTAARALEPEPGSARDLDTLAAAAAAEPTRGELHLQLGIAQLRAGDEDDARESLRRALFLAPSLWPAAYLLGELLDAEDPRAATSYFTEARRLIDRREDDAISSAFALSREVVRRAVLVRLARLEARAG